MEASSPSSGGVDAPAITTKTPEEIRELKRKLIELEKKKTLCQRWIQNYEERKASHQRDLAVLTGGGDEVRRAELESAGRTREKVEKFLQYDEDLLQHWQQEALRAEADRAATAATVLHQTCALPFYVSALPAIAQSFLDNQLDWDQEGVATHLNQIADSMIDWEEKLSTLLGLTEVQIHDLKERHFQEPVLLRRAVLRVWQDQQGLQATYRNLLRLCCEGEHSRSAEIICGLLIEKAERTGAISDKNFEAPLKKRPLHQAEVKCRAKRVAVSRTSGNLPSFHMVLRSSSGKQKTRAHHFGKTHPHHHHAKNN